VVIKPLPDSIYLIELCSGEQRHWRYLGPDSRAMIWWKDMDSGREFNEGSLMYAWWIIAAKDTSPGRDG